MAKSSPVSDTQTLLQSMLQRLKLQTNAERTKQQAPSPAMKLDCVSGESVYQFGDSKHQGSSPSIWRRLESPWSLHSPYDPLSNQSAEDNNSGTSATTLNSSAELDVISPLDDSTVPRWGRKQLKFSPRKLSDDNCGMLTSSTTENTLNPTCPSTPLPTAAVPGRKASGEHSGLGDMRKDDMNVEDKMTRMHTSKTSKRKWGNSGQKRWTQKVKERWKERHKKDSDAKQKHKPNEAPKSNHHPTPISPYPSTENTTTTAVTEVEGTDQHQQINNGPDETPPSLLDQMSETIFSFGSFNLMEEIFTGDEWSKFFQSSTNSQAEESTCINRDTATQSQSNNIQSHQGEQAIGNLWHNKWATDIDMTMAPSEINIESFQKEMDISDNSISQTKTSDFNLHFSQTFELLKNQLELFDSDLNHSQEMDLSQSEGDNQPTNQQQFIYQNSEPKATEGNVQQSPLSEQNLNQSQLPDPNNTQPEAVHEEVIPLLDLSYLQPKDNYTHGTLSRKRGHCTLSRGLIDRGTSENGEMDKGRDNAVIPLYPLHPAPNLSPASSVSSLKYSISHNSESTASTETVVKKRKLENTRRVHFAEEVVFLPPPICHEEEDEDEDEDGYDYGDEDDDEEGDTADEDEQPYHVEPQSRSSVPNWIMALRTKTKRKPKFKLPLMSSTPTKFKSSKSFI